jgi:hypothetical protein
MSVAAPGLGSDAAYIKGESGAHDCGNGQPMLGELPKLERRSP